MPSLNWIPRTTSGKSLKPPSLRQLLSAARVSWKTKPSQVFRETQFLVRVVQGGKARLDRVGGPDRHTVLGRKVVNGQQDRLILDQLFHRFGILGPEVAQETVKDLFHLRFGFRPPQMSCSPALALPWMDFGKSLSTLAVLCTQQRWERVSGHASSKAAQKPNAPLPIASLGGFVNPRTCKSCNTLSQDALASR